VGTPGTRLQRRGLPSRGDLVAQGKSRGTRGLRSAARKKRLHVRFDLNEAQSSQEAGDPNSARGHRDAEESRGPISADCDERRLQSRAELVKHPTQPKVSSLPPTESKHSVKKRQLKDSRDVGVKRQGACAAPEAGAGMTKEQASLIVQNRVRKKSAFAEAQARKRGETKRAPSRVAALGFTATCQRRDRFVAITLRIWSQFLSV